MNVVPAHAPDTLPIIFERGLVGVYHDWCESFGTYPRTYDLLHADHLFSRLKNRLECRLFYNLVYIFSMLTHDLDLELTNLNSLRITTLAEAYFLDHCHIASHFFCRCKHPVSIVVEMDRILRPGGWMIIRDKVEILKPLEDILRSLQWKIVMTFAQDKEGILCAQKTMWRP